MATLELKLDDGGQVFVDVVHSSVNERMAEVSDRKLQANFEKVSSRLAAVVCALEKQLEIMPNRPDSFEVEMGAELRGEADFWIVNGTAGAHFKVTMKWGK